MQVEWYGQSAFRLSTGRQTVFIDPFGDMSEMAASRGLQFEYPPIEGVAADLVLVTHGHLDHNAVEAIGGSPAVLRSTAGRLESPVGEVVGVNSEHDEKAGTERGPNTRPIRPGRRGPDDRGEQAAAICERLSPRWVVPMHYRSPRIGFLETEKEFVSRMPEAARLDSPRFATSELQPDRTPLTVVPAAP